MKLLYRVGENPVAKCHLQPHAHPHKHAHCHQQHCQVAPSCPAVLCKVIACCHRPISSLLLLLLLLKVRISYTYMMVLITIF
jgi:hypothetical protein